MLYLVLKKKTLALVLSLSVLLVAVVFVSFGYKDYASTAVLADVNWGLSFQTEGQPPIGNADTQSLKKMNAYYLGDTTQKKLYLTFDAGYENGYTAQILDTLKKHQVPATFFLVGNYLSTAPELVQRMVNEGHTVGNHTFSHPDMSAISDEKSFSEEMTKVEKLYKETTGQEMKKFYRPPQGKFSEQNLQMAQKMGYNTIFWSLAYVDWYNDKQPTKQQAFDKLIPRTHNGAIILLHSTSKTNAEILDELLTQWEDMGYQFGSIEELTN